MQQLSTAETSTREPFPLVGLTKAELAGQVVALGEPEKRAAMRASQIWQWLYQRGAVDFADMTNLPLDLRARLAEHCTIARPSIVDHQASVDGTHKWLLRFHDGQEVETVFIPESDRGALCVSTQVGCTLSCSFCHTGTMPLVRNLSAREIVQQILVARDTLGEWQAPDGPKLLSNIVVMGMGEPLFNYDATAKALRIAMATDGINFSRKKITLSTSGVVPRIAQVGEELGVGLAISLHAVRDDLRNELVPLNKKWPIAELLDACRAYPIRSKLITFEYVMLKGVNDSDAEAHELVQLLQNIPAKINLIPFNPWPGTAYECSSWARIKAFAAILEEAGYASPVRTPRGRDILAACGQLKTASQRQRGQRIVTKAA